MLASKAAREGNHKLQAVGLLNNVIKKANQGCKPMIRCELLLEDMISILRLDSSNPFLRKKFGSFSVQIILNRFLSVPYYLPYVSVGDTTERQTANRKNTWKVLLKISIQLFEIIPENLDFHSCCALFHGILSNGLLYTNLLTPLKKQFRFFENVLQSRRIHQCSAETKKIFLEATNIFIMTVGHESRQQTCIFGESVLKNVIAMYDERNTSPEVIKFLRIQMTLHHPRGARQVKDGAYCGQPIEWKEHLIRIYSNLVDTTIQNQAKSNRSKTYGNRDYLLNTELVELAVDVCYQLFLDTENQKHKSDESGGVEVTQIVPLDVTQQDQEECRGTKRRKLSMSFKSCLLDSLKVDLTSGNGVEKNSDEVIIPYLQIVSRIMQKYPIGFEVHLVNEIAKTVLDLIQDCKNAKVKSVLLGCSENMLKVFDVLHREFPSVDFLRLWESAVNTVSLNQCINEGNSLLR